MKYLVLVIIVAGMLSGATVTMAQESPAIAPADEIRENLRTYLDRMEAKGFTGGVLVATSNNIIFGDGIGDADHTAERPFDMNTVFPVGSIAKQFTGAAAMKAQSMGLFNTSDPISKYFDNVPDDKASVTIHHLLTHSSGLPGAIGHDLDATSRGDYIAEALATDLLFEPGSTYEYSNVGFSLVAAIIEQQSGMSFDAFMQEHLFTPAGMNQTGYVLSRFDESKLAHGYLRGEDWGTFVGKTWADDGPYWHLRGNGGIHSSLNDMYLWHKALLGTDVLADTEKAVYLAPHQQEGPGASSYYGYGWVIQETDRGLLIWHDGGNPYFSSDMRRYIDADVVIYVHSNVGDHKASRMMPEIANIVFGEDFLLPPLKVEQLSMADVEASVMGRRALNLLNAIGGSASELERFIDEDLSPRLKERFGVDGLRSGFEEDQERIGAVRVGKIEKPSDNRLAFTVQSEKDGRWRRFVILFDEADPYYIVGFNVEGAMPPE